MTSFSFALLSKDFKLVGLNSSALVFKSTFAAKVFLLELDFEVLDNFESLLLITICIYLSVSLRFTSFTLSWSFGYHNITERLARLKWIKNRILNYQSCQIKF